MIRESMPCISVLSSIGFDADNKLAALEGDEIGSLLAQSVQDGVVEKQPWYEPTKKIAGPPDHYQHEKPTLIP